MGIDVNHRNEFKPLISPALTRCPLEGDANLNEQILTGEVAVEDVAKVYKISEQEVMEIAAKHRF